MSEFNFLPLVDISLSDDDIDGDDVATFVDAIERFETREGRGPLDEDELYCLECQERMNQ